ncbi:uncharacterized protein LOC132953619 [Metopolophium dirhodum]|uniref:uncharacterized protein LOC132953619 n=1 Tax=Metopolophium dirhodum TaxID=44670 RepID=UPI00298FF855|nr:uncharacterized protein LOC132953619 [Metopolophium dirhodum]
MILLRLKINMNTLNTIETLFELSLNQLCKTMNEDTLQYVLKSSTPTICMEIIWKVLGLKLYDANENAVKSGFDIVQMDFEPLQCCMSLDIINPEIFEHFATNQQIIDSFFMIDTAKKSDGFDGIERINQNEIIKQFFLEIVEIAFSNALQVSLHSLGENNLLTAKIYDYPGTIYIYQEKYTESKEMYLKEIEIIKSILGTNNVEFANSIVHLTNLFIHYLYKFQEVELLLLLTINIYASIFDGPIREFGTGIERLIYTYKEFNNMERFNFYTNYLATINARYGNWFHALQYEISEENCTNTNLSLEKLKCILNGCSCGQ